MVVFFRSIGSGIDSLVHKYWPELLSAGATAAAAVLTEYYFEPETKRFVYSIFEPILDNESKDAFFANALYVSRFVESAALGSVLVKRTSDRIFPSKNSIRNFKIWLVSIAAAGVIGTGLITFRDQIGSFISNHAQLGYKTVSTQVQGFFVKPTLELNEKDLGDVVAKLQGNPEGVADFLQAKWERRYRTDLRPNLEMAIARSRPQLPDAKYLFKREGVPEEIAFLAITESHWKPKAESSAGAKGLYQFIESTAKNSGCKIDIGLKYDERENPYLSADCAARHLRYLKEHFKTWELALAAYNSGMPGPYLSQARGNANYHDYLRYLGKWLRSNPGADRVKWINENLNYPPHYRAIRHVLDLHYTPYFRTQAEQTVEIVNSNFPTIYSAARHYRVDATALKEYNPHVKDKNGRLPKGARIVVPKSR